jgi:hypothetical protein
MSGEASGGDVGKDWLVRTHLNVITGPFEKEEVARMITAGKLDLNDEVCPSHGYWIYLSEREEIAKFLGVEVPFDVNQKDDTTETGNEAETRTREIEASIKLGSGYGTSVVSGFSNKNDQTPLRSSFSIPEKSVLMFRLIAWIMLGLAGYMMIRLLHLLGR